MSGRPESYWVPWLGDVLGLRPCDLGDLTPEQLEECVKYVTAGGGSFG